MDDLVLQLTRARQLEIAAETFEQERNTVHATSALMLAAADAGWLTVDIAKVLRIRPGTASRRINEAWTDGLLPNTRKLTGTWRVYLRADLERVRNGPRRGVYLDRAALYVSIVGQ